MSLLSFLLLYIDKKALQSDFFKFIHPMAVGFLAFAAFRAGRVSIKNKTTAAIAVFSAAVTLLFFKNPIAFPILIVVGGIITNPTR